MSDRRGRAKGIGVPADEARDVLEGDFLELLLDAVEGEVSGVPRDDGHGERRAPPEGGEAARATRPRSEEHTSELQSRLHLVCRLLLEKKKKEKITRSTF